MSDHSADSENYTSAQAIPCTVADCKSVKYFAGRCNACQRTVDATLQPLPDPYAGLTETEEYMVRTDIPRDKVLAQTRKASV